MDAPTPGEGSPAVPPPLPPPLPRAAEASVGVPPKKTRKPPKSGWSRVLRVAMFSLGITIAFLFGLIRLFQKDDRGSAFATAEAFVRALKIGGAAAAPGSDEIGFVQAYDLLAKSEQERFPLQAFLQEWLVREQEFGEILSSEISKRRGSDGAGRLLITFRITFGDRAAVGRSDPYVYALALTMVREGDDWRVATYDLIPATGERTR